MDEDFFKDYPPVNGAQHTAPPPPPPAADPANPFVFADDQPSENLDTPSPDTPSPDEHPHAPTSNGGPPPDDNAEPECPAVTEWRAAFAKNLEQKLANERKVKAERAEQARHTLENMHAKWETKRNHAADANVKSETEFIRARDGIISRMSKAGDKPNWDIIPNLVDMSGKYVEGARDTSRMRQVLLRMKTN